MRNLVCLGLLSLLFMLSQTEDTPHAVTEETAQALTKDASHTPPPVDELELGIDYLPLETLEELLRAAIEEELRVKEVEAQRKKAHEIKMRGRPTRAPKQPTTPKTTTTTTISTTPIHLKDYSDSDETSEEVDVAPGGIDLSPLLVPVHGILNLVGLSQRGTHLLGIIGNPKIYKTKNVGTLPQGHGDTREGILRDSRLGAG